MTAFLAAKSVANLYHTEQRGPFVPGEIVALTGDEAHHAARVGRLKVGDHTLVGDGCGSLASAAVETVHGKQVELKILEAHTHPIPEPRIWLAQALAKGDRDELAIQVATELGVFGVIPFSAQRSVSQWRGDKISSGVARWQKIVEQASKQALRAWVPEVWEPIVATEIPGAIEGAQVLVLVPGASESLSTVALDETKPIVVVVGPEGGLDQQEISDLERGGATPVRVGSTVLRTSSAGPAALAVLHHRLGRL